MGAGLMSDLEQRPCSPGALLGVVLVLLTRAGRWTDRHAAIAADGTPIAATSNEAVAWSLPGALLRAANLYRVPHTHEAIQASLPYLSRAAEPAGLPTEAESAAAQAEIQALVRRAIVLAHEAAVMQRRAA